MQCNLPTSCDYITMNDIFSFNHMRMPIRINLSQIFFGRIQTIYFRFRRIADSLWFGKLLSFRHLKSFGSPILAFFLPNLHCPYGSQYYFHSLLKISRRHFAGPTSMISSISETEVTSVFISSSWHSCLGSLS